MQEQNKATIIKVAGPLVVANGASQAKMYEVVKLGNEGLSGEVIRIVGDTIYIQVYEETSGIGPGEPVTLTGEPLQVELGPGILGNIYDGIQRPLPDLKEKSGDFIKRGVESVALNREKKWHFKPLKKEGAKVTGGDVLGEVRETKFLQHKIMAPPYIKEGTLVSLTKEGDYTVIEEIAVIESEGKKHRIQMLQKWPIRNPRPIKQKVLPSTGLITGQRVIDSFFPIAKGGTGCVPGPFGSGKTVVQHQIAKWSDADIVIYAACGERGNEVADVLAEFPELKDPKTGQPLMERTVIIANTSNMPVAAREASVYTSVTIGEYFRDMGLSVIILADSTSRWAEALREISGRLEEMPGDEGYPAYLGSRTAAFYERAGAVECLGDNQRKGYLSVVGAVSPPGGDLSEPVTQNTLRVTKVFWALDATLAYKRHFPAINWLTSYSLYDENLKGFFREKGGPDFPALKSKCMEILQKESELEEIVRLVGVEALSEKDQFLLEIAKIIREDFLHQNAFLEVDTYTSLKKQYAMLKVIISLYQKGSLEIEQGKGFKEFLTPEIKDKVSKFKLVLEDNLDQITL
ncbi:V-type ATP synthase subunit A [bacterium (Candidatus Gribaldobacteria) CG23_combo_of_CG06-09_8_20_14_all_37_87_8]|uniref:V-type ATP synthase alpha chain n=2 Tax=Candidatus Gribaldobacteria TaxID=2798536 RepID=A0A2G9ZG14_9BACT|nr:MAG: V-type ATP synthase subunit A [Parcubacteria group bacterium CG1_02_37_13]PIP31520.1 MAG: V-type ATP synthase subunit A [bacterium (Candidatus Gribaldobacteria) CG23_combo_of_CG06-09_8_20_14_all_37_87_8]PIR90648.1 MAG: V-type ATP synthase subunit A [bacterium (Candidatus Gribaldobacteria) CG10_big_fil_rev_8_21_14_0_10_37_21]